MQLGVTAASTVTVGEQCTSLPYGDGLNCTGSDVNHLYFTGKERDTESGNDYFLARYYSSNMGGRFLTPDWSKNPQGVPYANYNNPQTLNLYAYVGDNPLSLADLDGHQCTDITNGPCKLAQAAKKNSAAAQSKSQQQSGIVGTIRSWLGKHPVASAVVGYFFGPGSSGGPGAGKRFSAGAKRQIIKDNQDANGGQTTCENCGKPTVPAQQSQRGVTPPGNETQVDHKYPMSRGGNNTKENGGVLCRDCNVQKSDTMPGQEPEAVPDVPEMPVPEVPFIIDIP